MILGTYIPGGKSKIQFIKIANPETQRMKKFHQTYAAAFQLFKNITEFIAHGIQTDEFSMYQLHSLMDKLQCVSRIMGSPESINELFEVENLQVIFCSLIQGTLKQIRQYSHDLIQGFQKDALKLSTFAQPKTVDIHHELHKSQMTKFFSSEKEPLQWQIETNCAESTVVLEQLGELYAHLDAISICQTMSSVEQSVINCNRLVETYIWERRFLQSQLEMVKGMTISSTISLLIMKIEEYLEDLDSQKHLQWIIKYVIHIQFEQQTQQVHMMTKLNHDTNFLFRKLFQHLDGLSEKQSVGQTTADDLSGDIPIKSKMSISTSARKKPDAKPNFYQCVRLDPNQPSSNSWKITNKKLYSYQHAIIAEEHMMNSSNEFEKPRSVEVLDNVDPIKRPTLNSHQKERLENPSNNCLSCNIF